MSNCNSCGSSSNCGCKSGPFTIPPSCGCLPDSNCPVPQKCAEKIDAACVYLNDYSIVDTGLPENVTMEQIVQMFSLFLTNPNCILPYSPCQSIPYVYPFKITGNSISIAWAASATATGYQVEYKNLNQLVWSTLPIQSNPMPNAAVIDNLMSNNTYFIRVNAFCNTGGTCYSVTLRINTCGTGSSSTVYTGSIGFNAGPSAVLPQNIVRPQEQRIIIKPQ
jgi:hypothetical protein